MISSRSDTQPVFDAIAERAGQLCRADGSRVWLVEGEQLRAMTHVRSDLPKEQ